MKNNKQERKNNLILKIDFHRSNFIRVVHTICLVFPVIMAFTGYFISEQCWLLLTKKTAAPELFKFGCTAVFFLISSIIIFIATRNANPIMKISLTDAPEQAD